MNNVLITYQVEKTLSMDLDVVIDAVIKDLEHPTEFDLYEIQCLFGDNMEDYLRKLNIIDESDDLPYYVQDDVLSAFTDRLLELYPELNE